MTIPRSPSPDAELLIAFANSVDHELGTDDLATAPQLGDWLQRHGLLERRLEATGDELGLARELRDGLHEALVANHDGADTDTDTADGAGTLEAAAEHLPLRLSGSGGRPGLRPVHEGVRGALSRIVAAVHGAVADGTWPRVKICSSDACAWAYFDTTKNSSRAYCEWGCGNRIKTRNYRARKKAAL